MEYSTLALQHGENPTHIGELEEAQGHAFSENPICGDTVEFWVNLDSQGKCIEEVVFKAFGCLAATAASDVLCDLIKGKSVEEAASIKDEDIAEALGGLPATKYHGASLAHEAFQEALHQAEELAILEQEAKSKKA